MANKIKINCKRVYDTAVFYDESIQKINSLKQELLIISHNISKVWQGLDSKNFNVKFNNHIEKLDDLIFFLESKSMLLKKIASLHNSVDDNFADAMKRVGSDE